MDGTLVHVNSEDNFEYQQDWWSAWCFQAVLRRNNKR